MHRKKRNFGRLLIAFMFGAVLLLAVPSQADIMLMPICVVFQGHQRVADILVLNNSDKTATFRLSWLYQKQAENGSYQDLDGPINPAYDVGKMVIFSPRQMTLPPGARQRVRLSLRRPGDLPDGEYHAHLRLQRVSQTNAPATGLLGPEKVQTVVSINIGFGIPVVIRQGRGTSTASISNPHFIPGSANGDRPPSLEVTLNRSGTFGTFGSLKVYWTPPGGNEKQIGEANNVNVFTEIAHRTADVVLSESRIAGGTIRVVYSGDGPDQGASFDEKTFPIGGK